MVLKAKLQAQYDWIWGWRLTCLIRRARKIPTYSLKAPLMIVSLYTPLLFKLI